MRYDNGAEMAYHFTWGFIAGAVVGCWLTTLIIYVIWKVVL